MLTTFFLTGAFAPSDPAAVALAVLAAESSSVEEASGSSVEVGSVSSAMTNEASQPSGDHGRKAYGTVSRSIRLAGDRGGAGTLRP